MKYPKPVMNLSALMRMGISETFLRKAYADRNQTFAWKANPTKDNSPILFDTVGLEEYRLKQIDMEKQARKLQSVI